MYAVFNENLHTGNELIDGQHKEIIEKINKLVVACENGSCQLESIKMLDYLADYTEYHFQEEEALQKEAGYPGNHQKAAGMAEEPVHRLLWRVVLRQSAAPDHCGKIPGRPGSWRTFRL